MEISNKTHPIEYGVWYNMKYRCYNQKSIIFKYYGGRGISVCDRWLGKDGLKYFIEDMGEKPTPKHTLDRINSNGNYEPNNCRWATMKEQQRNRRNNKIIEYNGEKGCIAEVAEKLGIKYYALCQKISPRVRKRAVYKKVKKIKEPNAFIIKLNQLLGE